MEGGEGLEKKSKLTSVGEVYLALKSTDNHFRLDKFLNKEGSPYHRSINFFQLTCISYSSDIITEVSQSRDNSRYTLRHTSQFLIRLINTNFGGIETFPGSIYLVKNNIRDTRTMCEIYSKLTVRTPERLQWQGYEVHSRP